MRVGPSGEPVEHVHPAVEHATRSSADERRAIASDTAAAVGARRRMQEVGQLPVSEIFIVSGRHCLSPTIAPRWRVSGKERPLRRRFNFSRLIPRGEIVYLWIFNILDASIPPRPAYSRTLLYLSTPHLVPCLFVFAVRHS